MGREGRSCRRSRRTPGLPPTSRSSKRGWQAGIGRSGRWVSSRREAGASRVGLFRVRTDPNKKGTPFPAIPYALLQFKGCPTDWQAHFMCIRWAPSQRRRGHSMPACGLDFGTSNSALGIVRGGVPVLAPVEGAETLIPSAIFFDFENHGRVLYGRGRSTPISSSMTGG